LKYWEFTPTLDDSSDEASNEQSRGKHARGQGSSDTQRTRVEHARQDSGTRSKWSFKSWGKSKANQRASEIPRPEPLLEPLPVEGEKEKGKEKPAKKMPVCLATPHNFARVLIYSSKHEGYFL